MNSEITETQKINDIASSSSTIKQIDSIDEELSANHTILENIQSEIDVDLSHITRDIFLQLATKIWACSNWVFQYNSPKNQSQETQESDWNTAQNICKEKYKNMPLGDALEDLTKKQAELFWFDKNCPQFQSESQELDDYFNGKRFVAYLIADILLENCRNNNCAKVLLQKEYVEYLKILSVEEFLRHKAYLIWVEKCNNVSAFCWGTSKQDFNSALHSFDDLLTNCKKHNCSSDENAKIWLHAPISSDDKDRIIRGKKNAIKRIWNDANLFSQEVETFVDQFYGHYIKFLNNAGTSDYTVLHSIINQIDKKLSVVNMFEYISKCALKCFLTHETNELNSAKTT